VEGQEVSEGFRSFWQGQSVDLEFALALRTFLKRHGWPVNEITEVLLVGRRGEEYAFQLVAAYPTDTAMVDQYITDMFDAMQRAIGDIATT
jgi:hypothetical protein